MTTIAVLPGDGIGPEIAAPAVQALTELLGASNVQFEEYLFGGASIDEHGTALTDETLAGCRGSDAVLLAAVGGPKWDTTDPNAPRPEQGLLGLRKELGLFANLRPVRPLPALYGASALKPEIIEGTNLVVVRELTGGIYFGEKTRTETSASDLCSYTTAEVERIARVAFELAGRRSGRLASVDKANVLETSRQWRQVVHEVAADYPAVELEDVLVDNCAMQLISRPSSFDVIVTENLFGDILSDEAAMLTGSIGMLPSASLGAAGDPGLFEPVHGSAPDIAGKGVANPLAMFLSTAMLLRDGLGRPKEAAALESAVDAALADGLRTHDLGGTATTAEAVADVFGRLHA
jgi:3-isopropylmalate dehydrogenase